MVVAELVAFERFDVFLTLVPRDDVYLDKVREFIKHAFGFRQQEVFPGDFADGFGEIVVGSDLD